MKKLDEQKIIDVICKTWTIPLGSDIYMEFYKDLRKLARNLKKAYSKGGLFV